MENEVYLYMVEIYKKFVQYQNLLNSPDEEIQHVGLELCKNDKHFRTILHQKKTSKGVIRPVAEEIDTLFNLRHLNKEQSYWVISNLKRFFNWFMNESSTFDYG